MLEPQFLSTWIALIAGGVSAWAFQNPQVKDRLLLKPYRVWEYKEYWRVFTHAWIHSDWTHLLINAFVLVQFAPAVETLWSGWHFVALYLGGSLAAAWPALRKHKGNPAYASLGASGAIASVLMAYVVLAPDATLLLFFVIPLPAWAAAILFFVYEGQMARSNARTGIAHDAHFFGALWGVVYALSTQPGLMRHWWDLLNG